MELCDGHVSYQEPGRPAHVLLFCLVSFYHLTGKTGGFSRSANHIPICLTFRKSNYFKSLLGKIELCCEGKYMKAFLGEKKNSSQIFPLHFLSSFLSLLYGYIFLIMLYFSFQPWQEKMHWAQLCMKKAFCKDWLGLQMQCFPAEVCILLEEKVHQKFHIASYSSPSLQEALRVASRSLYFLLPAHLEHSRLIQT